MNDAIQQQEVIVEKAFQDLDKEIELTEKAAIEIKSIMEKNQIPETFGLRVGVKGGGCSGLQYVLGFAEKPEDKDKIIPKHGIQLFIDVKSLFYLSGSVIDFSDGLQGKGFTFTNPNSQKTCGCGNSFTV